MFKCNWIDNNMRMKQDELKFTLVNFKYLLYKENRVVDEPFIIASQAEQVWYVQDPVEPDWRVVVKARVEITLTCIQKIFRATFKQCLRWSHI